MYKKMLIIITFISLFNYQNIIANYNANDKYNSYIFCVRSNLVITDSNDFPIFMRELPNEVSNFKMHNPGEFTYFDFNNECFYLLDSAFVIQDTIKTVNNYHTDFHDIKIDSNGNIYLIGNEYVIMDVSDVFEGGSSNATVVGSVVQILNSSKELIFEWKSLDHIDVGDVNTLYVNETSLYIDYFHANSIDYDNDTNIYISSRHMDQLIKIDKNGNVVWRLGGKNNEFTLLNDAYYFSGQHSINYVNDTIITIFDNGNTTHSNFSRGVKYLIDQENKTFKLLNEYKLDKDVISIIKGNISHFNKNIVVGWGANTRNLIYSEFDSLGNVIKTFKIDTVKTYNYATYKVDWMHNIFSSNLDTLEYETTFAGSSKSKNIILTNNLDDEIVISEIFCTNHVFAVEEILPITIPANGTVNVNIQFIPDENSGEHIGDMYFINKTTDPYNQQIAISLHLIGDTPDQKTPEITIHPDDESTNIGLDTSIYISFSENIRLYDDKEIEDQDIFSGISLKKNAVDGENVEYYASFDNLINQIIIDPINLENDQVYYLHIDDVFEDYSDNLIKDTTIHFATKSTVGIDYYTKQQLKIYPNPVYDVLNIVSSKEDIKNIKMYDLTGRMIKTYKDLKAKSCEVNMVDFENGIYIVEVENAIDEVIRYKIYKY